MMGEKGKKASKVEKGNERGEGTGGGYTKQSEGSPPERFGKAKGNAHQKTEKNNKRPSKYQGEVVRNTGGGEEVFGCKKGQDITGRGEAGKGGEGRGRIKYVIVTQPHKTRKKKRAGKKKTKKRREEKGRNEDKSSQSKKKKKKRGSGERRKKKREKVLHGAHTEKWPN